jgi:hypothetical protein
MTDAQWLQFFKVCARELAPLVESWCAWTTFRSLGESVQYWAAPLPRLSELGPSSTHDGGTWGQPFLYSEIAHLIIPRQFQREDTCSGAFQVTEYAQDLDSLAAALRASGIPHQLGKFALEVKLY